MKLTLEVEVEAAGGFSDNDIGVVRDNARQLKFKAESTGFGDRGRWRDPAAAVPCLLPMCFPIAISGKQSSFEMSAKWLNCLVGVQGFEPWTR